MTLVLDAGAFISVERADRDTIALLKGELLAGSVPVTHGGVVGQIWRGGGGNQAMIARLLPGVDVRPLDEAMGRRTGVLLSRSRQSDVIDPGVVLLATDGDTILTSDAGDLSPLALAAGLHVDIVPV